jgi:hypothetical protein
VATLRRAAGFLSMKMSTLRVQLRSVEDNLLTTQVSIRRLEHLVAELAEDDADRLEAERQLVHLRSVRSAFEEIRSGLVTKLQSIRTNGSPGIPGIGR